MKRLIPLLLSLFISVNLTAQINCSTILYVTPTGNPVGTGAIGDPVTLARALTLVTASQNNIRVLNGVYAYSQKFVVPSSTVIDGSYEIVAGEWVKNSALSTIFNVTTSLEVQSGAGHFIAFQLNGVTNVYIKDVQINNITSAFGTTNNLGNSAYGVHVTNTNNFFITRTRVTSVNAAAGSNGTTGASGANGNAARQGNDADFDGTACLSVGFNDGRGGAGAGPGPGASGIGSSQCDGTGNGGNGGNGVGVASGGGGGGGGAGGYQDDPNIDGRPGGAGGIGGAGAAAGAAGAGGNSNSGSCSVGNGTAGTNGANGSAGANNVTVGPAGTLGAYYVPGAQAGSGTTGAGGAGGGGGQADDSSGFFGCIVNDGSGAQGGGGGGGGAGGAGGTGGYGGGGTFGIYAYIGNTGAYIHSVATATGTAGTGGTGGAGGSGGTGGSGAAGGGNTNGGEVGFGGTGGNGGTGGAGGSGAPGAAGVSTGVGGQTVTGTTIPNPVTLRASMFGGCTNSEIIITKSAGALTMDPTAQFIPDLNVATSSYNTGSATSILSYNTVGHKDVVVGGTNYEYFVYIRDTRALPTFAASMSAAVCEGNAFSMSTPASGSSYEWVIFPASGSTAIPTAIYTTSVASWTTPVTGVTTNYRVRLRVKDDCCGWSAPVYYNFTVVGASVGPVASGVSICENNTAALTATGTGSGNITWYSDALGQVPLQSTPGVTSNYTTNVLTQNTVYYVGEGIAGCSGTLTSVPVTVNSAPNLPSATAAPVCAGQSAIMNAAGAGGTYSWYNVPSAGAALSTGPSYNAGALAAGTYTFYLSENNGSCSSDRTPVSVVVNANPAAPTVAPVTICTGTATNLSATGTGTINWYSDAGLTNLVGTGSTYTTPVLSSNTNYFVTQTNASGCSSTSSTLAVTTSGAVAPSIAINASSTSICPGNPVTFTASTTNGGATPTYDWFVNGVSQATNATTFNSSTLNNNDVITAQLSSSATCATPTNANSNSVVITVGSSVTPTIAINSTATTICAGTPVSFSASTGFGGTSPTIQWQVNGANVGTNNPTYSNSGLNNGDVVTAILTSNAGCVSTTTANSNSIAMVVNPGVTPSISISSSATTICAGTAVNFTATPTNAGATPTYEWYINGIAQGNNSTAFSSSTLNPSDMISAQLISSATCASTTPTGSNSIVMTVNPAVTPTASITSSASSTCAGSMVSFYSSITSGGTTPSYQWTVNGSPVGSDNPAFNSATLANGDVVGLTLTSNAACTTSATATSNTIAMTIAPNVLPTLAISASTTSICAGDIVTFNGTPTNMGAAPTYEWYVNGVAQGNNSTTFTSSTLNQLDVVAALLTSNAACATPSSVASNSVVMTVDPIVTPTITITASNTTICEGTTVIFTANTTSSGASPTIQWTVNGVPIGSNSATYSSSTLATGDVVQATLTSSANCLTTTTATSNSIAMAVNPNVIPTITISASTTSICNGTSVTFTANGTNTGATPVYEWFVNGVAQSNNSTSFVSSTLNDGDVISAQLISDAPCASPSLVSSNSLVMNVSMPSTPTASITVSENPICAGDLASFYLSYDDAGAVPSISWTVNGTPVSTSTVAYTSNSLNNGDVIQVVLTSNAMCPTAATVNSNSIALVVSTSLTPSIMISPTASTICTGTSVTFSSAITNGGATPTYEWYINGVAQGFNGPIFASSTLADGDIVTAQLMSSASCATSTNVNSNIISMTVNSPVTPTISITSSATSICAGEPVTFFATVTNEGTAPIIQWTVNGAPVGTNSSMFTTSTLASGDVVAATLTSNAPCATAATVNSNSITLTVSSNVTPIAFISVPSTIFCPGASVTFSSTVSNGGATPTYDWYLNGVSTGISTPTYTNSSLNNGDVVMLVFTSSSVCATSPTVISNSITMFSSTVAVASISASSLTGTLCEGSPINFVAIPINATGTLSYQWQVNGVNAGLDNAVFNSPALAANDLVTVILSYQDACGNNLTATSNVLIIVSNPVISAGPDATMTIGVPVTLNGTSSLPGTILWSPAGTLSSPNILNPIANPTLTTEYILTVQTVNGCTASDSVWITVNTTDLEIFTSFTPNGDGINDTWVIQNADLYPEISVQIFNRWGNLLYEQSNTYVPWDGTNEGKKLPSDTYFYIIQLTPDTDALKGPVTIVR